jgi:hypothetical protein
MVFALNYLMMVKERCTQFHVEACADASLANEFWHGEPVYLTGKSTDTSQCIVCALENCGLWTSEMQRAVLSRIFKPTTPPRLRV